MNILWIQPSGSLAMTSIFEDCDPVQYAELLQERGDIPADWVVAGTNIDWQQTGWRHEAHRWNGQAVVVDFSAAVEETKTRLRLERDPLFHANDLALRDAVAEGDETKRMAGIAERDRLRDITLLADDCETLDELKSISCRML